MTTLTAIRTDRDVAGRLVREVLVERVMFDGRERQTTVREWTYDDAGDLVVDGLAVEPQRAREYVSAAEQSGALS